MKSWNSVSSVPAWLRVTNLVPGQVGYIVTGIKVLGNVHVGDTVTDFHNRTPVALPGYATPQQMVFCGMYPHRRNGL